MDENSNLDNQDIWIFAYGSLCWNPGFSYEQRETGFINGFSRRFYQGNTVHRGTQEKAGRVATLIADEGSQTFGCAYRIRRNQLNVLEYLEQREKELGGYECIFTVFFPEMELSSNSSRKQYKENDLGGYPCLCYVAFETNTFWLGQDTEENIARDVRDAEGICGPNAEYVINLYKYHQTTFPYVWDEHLEEIVKHL